MSHRQSHSTVLNGILGIVKKYLSNERNTRYLRDTLFTICLPGFDWTIVLKKAAENYVTFSDSLIQLLTALFQKKSIIELREIYYKMRLQDVIKRNKTQVWNAVYLMKEEKRKDNYDEIAIEIARVYKTKALNAMVYWRKEESKMWMIVVEIKRGKNGVKHMAPRFFVLSSTFPCLCLKPAASTTMLNIVSKACGYGDYKRYNLSGKHVDSLVDMLKNRYQCTSEFANEMQSVGEDDEIEVILEEDGGGIDFHVGELDARIRDAQKLIFNNKPLETLKVTTNLKWFLDDFPELMGEMPSLRMRIKAPNVKNCLREWVTREAIRKPYPAWLKKFMISGRNELIVAPVRGEDEESPTRPSKKVKRNKN